MCAYIKMFSFTRVRLHQNDSFFSCAHTSKCLLLLVDSYIKMIAHSFSHTPKCFLSLVCAYIKMFAFFSCPPHQNDFFFSCAHTSKCLLLLVDSYIKMIAYSCAHTPKCFLSLVCAYIKMIAFSRVCLLQNGCC